MTLLCHPVVMYLSIENLRNMHIYKQKNPKFSSDTLAGSPVTPFNGTINYMLIELISSFINSHFCPTKISLSAANIIVLL